MIRMLERAVRRVAVCCVALVCAFGSAQAAEAWPAKPIRWVVPIPPGGGPDIIARRVAPVLGKRLGQAVVVENLPGGAHNIAMQAVARSAPDGYTLLHGLTSLVSNPHLYRLEFDPAVELAPVARLVSTEWVILGTNSLAVQRLEELVAIAKSGADRVACAITGGLTEIACRALAAVSGAPILQVSYKGGPQALNDLVNGAVQLRVVEAGIAAPFVQAARVRAIATLNPRRGNSEFGDLRPAAETYPGFEFVTWQGLMVRAGTPAEHIARLGAELEAILADPDVGASLRATGNRPAYAPAAAFDTMLRNDLARYGRLIRELGIRPE